MTTPSRTTRRSLLALLGGGLLLLGASHSQLDSSLADSGSAGASATAGASSR